MAFKGRDPVRTKIVLDNKIIEQVSLFNYLGNMISYEGELDIDNKLPYFSIDNARVIYTKKGLNS